MGVCCSTACRSSATLLPLRASSDRPPSAQVASPLFLKCFYSKEQKRVEGELFLKSGLTPRLGQAPKTGIPFAGATIIFEGWRCYRDGVRSLSVNIALLEGP